MRIPLFLLLVIVQSAGVEAAELPSGFGGVQVGDPWLLVKDRYSYTDLADHNSDSGRRARECGFFSLAAQDAGETFQVTVHNFVVTDISRVRKLPPNSDLSQEKGRLIEAYGPPAKEEFRNIFGVAVGNESGANYIILHYKAPNPLRVELSGAALWQRQDTLRYQKARLHENRNQSCVRKKRKATHGG